jgi:hypothetical protein
VSDRITGLFCVFWVFEVLVTLRGVCCCWVKFRGRIEKSDWIFGFGVIEMWGFVWSGGVRMNGKGRRRDSLEKSRIGM